MTRDLVSFEDGEIFLLGRYPDEDLQKGTKISLICSPIFKNNQEISTTDETKNMSVGFFSNLPVLLIFLLSVLITKLNIFLSKKFLQIALVFATMALSVISLIYIFYF